MAQVAFQRQLQVQMQTQMRQQQAALQAQLRAAQAQAQAAALQAQQYQRAATQACHCVPALGCAGLGVADWGFGTGCAAGAAIPALLCIALVLSLGLKGQL